MDKLPTSTVCCDSVLLPNPIFHQDDFVRSALKSTQTENPAKSLDAVRKYVARGPGVSFFSWGQKPISKLGNSGQRNIKKEQQQMRNTRSIRWICFHVQVPKVGT